MPVTRQGFVLGTAATFATIGIITPARAADFELKYGHDLPAGAPDQRPLGRGVRANQEGHQRPRELQVVPDQPARQRSRT